MGPKTPENVQKYQIQQANLFRTISANFGRIQNPKIGAKASEIVRNYQKN